MKAYSGHESKTVVAFPNPAENIVTIVVNDGIARLTTEQDLQVLITGNLGSRMVSTSCHSTDVLRFNVGTWPAGTYQVTVTSAAGLVATTRFAVMR